MANTSASPVTIDFNHPTLLSRIFGIIFIVTTSVINMTTWNPLNHQENQRAAVGSSVAISSLYVSEALHKTDIPGAGYG